MTETVKLTEADDDSRAGIYDFCADCRQKFARGEQRIIIGRSAYHERDCGPSPLALRNKEHG